MGGGGGHVTGIGKGKTGIFHVTKQTQAFKGTVTRVLARVQKLSSYQIVQYSESKFYTILSY